MNTATEATGDRYTLSVIAAGRLLNIGRNAAYEGVRRGEIPAVKIGKSIRVPRAALMRLLGESETPPAA